MTAKSELDIEYDDRPFPVAAKCTICGEEMPKREPRAISTSETILLFARQFSLHKNQKHPREDVSKGTKG
jgi:hypothetical protein